MADDTVIAAWGDHGFHLGDHGLFEKWTTFEQATRSPLLIAAPGMTDKGGHAAGPTEFIDLYPTLASLAGLPAPKKLDGLDLTPMLKDPKASLRFAAMSQWPRKGHMGYTFRSERYRYTCWIKKDVKAGEKYGPVTAQELYDYQIDPHETENLVNKPEYAEQVKAFKAFAAKHGVLKTG